MPLWRNVCIAALIGVLFWCQPVIAGPRELTWSDLAGRMVDLEYLATLPAEGETSAMWSSYDRASTYDADAGRYRNWHANKDGDGFIRQEGDGIVMAEMTGPGVVWRIWSAEVRTGNIRIYIDDQPEPVIDMPFAHLFDGQHAPFNYPALSYQTPVTPGEFAAQRKLGGGRNLYFPIPYQKSCRIVAGPDWGKYFHVNYTTFPEGTKVPSFTAALPAEAKAALQRVNDLMTSGLGSDPAGTRQGEERIVRQVTVAPGQRSTIVTLSGPRAITALRCTVPQWDKQTQMAALRQLVLQVRWDGQAEPAVWAPLGDFFAAMPFLSDYRTLITGVQGNQMYAYWYMPFAQEAVLELVNDGDVARDLSFEIVHAPLNNGFEGMGHFHAKWHRGDQSVPEYRWPDWTVLRTQGRGRFCGMALDVWNPRYGNAPREVAGPGLWWWGEGDEKFHVDGERMPSTFGTGTEDYFGYAWCDPAVFAQAFHAQPVSEGNAGHQALVRYQVAENVPFQKSFDAYLEKYFPDEYPTRYATVAYWYLDPSGVDPHGQVPLQQRVGYYERPIVVAGGYRAIAGRGAVTTQDMGPFRAARWTHNTQLWWSQARPGDKLDVLLAANEAGRYQLAVVLTRAPDYAIVQLHLDGKPVGEPIDLYSPTVNRTRQINLGTHELAAGDHTLTVEILGANPQAKPGHMFGLDEVFLRPVQDAAAAGN